MKKFINPMTAKIVVRPSHPALKIAVTLLIVFSTAALIALGWVHGAILEQTQALAKEAAAIEYSNSILEERVKDPDAVQTVKAIAKEELGLVDPNTVIIDPK